MQDHEIFERIGEDGFARLVRAFYRQVPDDDILGPMYPPADMAGAERLGAAHVAEAVQYRPEGVPVVTALGRVCLPWLMVRVPPAGPRPLAARPEAVGAEP